MKRILLVNPNTTASMTDKIAACAQHVASPDVKLVVRNPAHGPESIEGHYDSAIATMGLIEEVRRAAREDDIDGVVVACFDDPGIGACRELISGPVIGICEASLIAATLVASSFSVVTTLPRSVPIIEDLVEYYGKARRCRRVRAVDLPVLSLEQDGDTAGRLIRQEVLRAIDEDHCDAVVLGCAGMADLAGCLAAETGLSVIDGVVAGVKLIEAMIGAGLSTSKTGTYAAPRSKRFA